MHGNMNVKITMSFSGTRFGGQPVEKVESGGVNIFVGVEVWCQEEHRICYGRRDDILATDAHAFVTFQN